MLGKRSEEKNLLHKKFFFQYAGRAQPREKIAFQEIFLSAGWASKAQRKFCSTRNLTFTMLGDQHAENKFETQNADWQIDFCLFLIRMANVKIVTFFAKKLVIFDEKRS